MPVASSRDFKVEPRPDGRRRWLLQAAGLAAMAGWGGALHAAGAPADSRFTANFKGLKLQDQEGRPFGAERLAGRVALVNFVFTGCSTVCPVQTRALAELQQQLPAATRARVQFVSVSLDPLSDTPAVLKAYAQRLGVDFATWSFVTGRPGDIERLSDALRLFRPGPDVRKPDDHATAVWLVDRQGQLRMRYAGNPVDVKRLLREIPALDELSRGA